MKINNVNKVLSILGICLALGSCDGNNKAKLVEGNWVIQSIECSLEKPVSLKEHSYLHTQNSPAHFTYHLNFGNENTLTETEALPHAEESRCRTVETLKVGFDSENEFSLESSMDAKGSPHNGVHCGQPSSKSLLVTYGLADAYSYTVSGNTLTATSKTDGYCSKHGISGAKTVIIATRQEPTVGPETKLELPSVVGTEWAQDQCGNRRFSLESNMSVDELMNNALFYVSNGKNIISGKHFFYFHLGYEALVDLYGKLHARRDEGNLFNTLRFDVRDYMIRLAINDNGAAAFFKSNVRDDRFASLDLDPKHSHFHPMAASEVCPMATLAQARIFRSEAAHSPSAQTRLRVFHGAMEAHNLRVGGVASFVSGLVQAENRHTDQNGERDIDGALVTPFYDVLKRRLFDTAEYVGFVDHEVDHVRVRTTVYKVNEQGIEQYLLHSDQGFKRGLYDIGEPANLYKNFADESWIYYSTALASFSALYRGASGNENVDVLQINDWHLGMTSAILNQELNPKRREVGLAPVATVATTHELNEFQGKGSGSYLFRKVGLKQPPTKKINMQALFQIFSNVSNTVSKSVAEEMRDPDPSVGFGLGELFSELTRMNRFFGITNGIDVDSFDPTRALGSLNVQHDYSDLAEKKAEAKKKLFEAGVIGSDVKPLFLYVGRLSKEKGTDALPEFVRLVIDRYQGQVVIMGSLTDGSVDQALQELETISRDPRYANLFRFYTNVKADQLEPLEGVKARRGDVIRFAADFTFVPSIQEACGLVPVEAMAMGSGVFTSNVHGLQDLCKPLDQKDLNGNLHDLSSFTCATFKRDRSGARTRSNLDESLGSFLDKWNAMSQSDKRMTQLRWINEAQEFAWDREGGAMAQYKNLYLRALEPDSPSEAVARARLTDSYVNNY